MSKPKPRIDLPPRASDNLQRALDPAPDPDILEELSNRAHYRGYAKHKAAPKAFGLAPYTKPRGDSTLCDAHAGFTEAQISVIPRLLQRGIKAGLVASSTRVIWTISDQGWIFEGRITNIEQREYHGYPLRPSEPIAEAVYQRFHAWAAMHGEALDRQAAANCRDLYGFTQ